MGVGVKALKEQYKVYNELKEAGAQVNIRSTRCLLLFLYASSSRRVIFYFLSCLCIIFSLSPQHLAEKSSRLR